MNYNKFAKKSQLVNDDIFRNIFHENKDKIKVKKEEKAVKNIQIIYNTTLDLSIEKGFQNMSLRDLSNRSGLSMGAIYSYISSKDELLDMILNQGRQIGMQILSEEIFSTDDPVKKFHTAVRIHLYMSEIMYKWFYFSYMETKNLNRKELKKSIESELFTEQIFIDIFEQGISEKIFVKKNAILMASSVKAMLQDWYLKRWKYKKRKISVDAYADFIIDFVESALSLKKPV